MMNICRVSLFSLLLLLGSNVNAQWFDAKGRAPIANNDKDIARNMAVQDALKHALLFTGAQVSSISNLTNGLLSTDRFEVRSHGSVRNLQLISEDTANGVMVVHIRVDIVPSKTMCKSSELIKLVAMTNFPLRYRNQAANGAIFNIGAQAANQLFDKMSSHEGNFRVTELFPIAQKFNQSNQPFSIDDNQQVPQQLLAQQADSQYLLTAEIEDLSIAKSTSKWLGLITNSPIREFTISFTLFDGLNGEKVWNKRYSTRAPWTFKKTQRVDTASHSFWQSPYGASINNQLANVLNDIDDKLQCINVKGNVIKVDSDHLTVNLGKRNGIKMGDSLNIYHLTTFTDNRGIIRQSTTINPTKFLVKELYQNHLKAQPDDDILYGDIQNDALVVVAP